MRILMVSQYFSPEVGATQTRMHYFAKTLAQMGHELTVICEVPNHPAGIVLQEYRGKLFVRSREDGFEVIRLWVFAHPRKTALRRILFYVSFLVHSILAGLFLTSGKYDAVIATSPPLPVGLAGYVMGLFKRCPFILDIRDLWPLVAPAVGELKKGLIYKFAERLENFLYHKAAAITCVTRSFVDYVISKHVLSDRVFFVPNGTIPELFNPAITDPRLRNVLGIDDKFVVSFCGNHGVAQGLFNVLEAAKLLRIEKKILFCFIGEGPVKRDLLAKKEKDNIQNAHFLPQVPLNEIARYINTSDLLLVPLSGDKVFDWFIPSKMFDFMACGKPVVLAVNGEARKILEESRGGVYVPPDNPRLLAEMILQLSRDREKLAEMGNRGRAYVLSHFTRDVQANYLEEILLHLTRERPRPLPIERVYQANLEGKDAK